MKRTFFIAIITIAYICLFSSCKEDNYVEWKLINDEWWEQHRNDEGYTTSSSGLKYQVLYAGGINRPDDNDYAYIKYNYKLYLIDGVIVDEKENVGSYLGEVVTGFKEGIRKIGTGGVIKMCIPYGLGYGESGSGINIPPYSHLIFEVELINVIN